MYFSIHHKINLTLLVVSISVAVLIEALVKNNKYGLKTKNKTLNVFLTSLIIYTVLYCIAKYTNLHQGIEMYEGYKEHMTNSDEKTEDKKEEKEKEEDEDEDDKETKEEFLFSSSKRPSTEKHQIDKKVKQTEATETELDEELLRKSVSDNTDTQLLRSIKGELESLRLQMIGSEAVKENHYENQREQRMHKIQSKIVNIKTPLKFEQGWSILKQPGQWQFPAVYPPQCLAKGTREAPKFGAKPTYDVLGKPFSEYLSSDKFKQNY